MTTQTSATAAQAAKVFSNVYRLDCPFGDGGLVHIYYVDAPEPALIDTAVRQSAAAVILPALQAAGFSLDRVRHIFNTHGHWDHMGGNEAVRAVAKQAKTYVHAEDRHLLERLGAHTGGYVTYPARIMGDEKAVRQTQEMVERSIDCPTPADVLVKDGDLVDLGDGNRIRVLHTPGHSLGSTSYLLESAGAMFTGDGVQGLGSRPGQLPLVFEDAKAYRGTIARLSEQRLEGLCLGHSFCGLTPESGRDPVRRGAAAQAFLEESGQAAKTIEEGMRLELQGGQGRPFLEVARAVLAKISPSLGVELDASGLSTRSLATLHAFYREQTGAPLPA